MKIKGARKYLWNLPEAIFGFIVIVFFINSCRSPRLLLSIKSPPLKFNEMYIYDNGKDTIIKDYEGFNVMRDFLLAEKTTLANRADTFAIGPGSTHIESLMFYPEGTVTMLTFYKRDSDYKEQYESHRWSRENKVYYTSNLKVAEDGTISFSHGKYERGLFINYFGRVSNDTLYLKLSYQPTNANFIVTDFHAPPDSLRIYVLHPMLK
jgi:hypothetical protein